MYPPVPIVPTTLISIPIHSWGSPYTHGDPHTLMGISMLMGIPIPTANRLKRLGLKRCLGFRPPLSGLGLAIAALPASTPTVLESNLHAARTQTPQFSSGGYTTQQVVRIASRRHSSDRLLQLAVQPAVSCKHRSISRGSVPSPGDTVTPVLRATMPRGTQLPQFSERTVPVRLPFHRRRLSSGRVSWAAASAASWPVAVCWRAAAVPGERAA